MDILQASKINIKNHKRIYHSREGYKIRCVHEDQSYPILANVIDDFSPELVIELGTSWGGLTKFFEDHTNDSTLIYSFDRPKASRRPDINKFNGARVTFLKDNILAKPVPLLIGLVRSCKRKLLYCDNGSKVKEVLMYGACLEGGDLLGVHDWPREIYTDYGLLKPAARKLTSPEEIEALKCVLKKFSPLQHERFLQNGLSTRFWIKKYY